MRADLAESDAVAIEVGGHGHVLKEAALFQMFEAPLAQACFALQGRRGQAAAQRGVQR